MSEPIRGRMFRDLHADYDAFFDYGPGAMVWERDEEGRRVLFFLAPPCAESRSRFDTARIYCERSENDWARPGPVSGWDGDEARPTFEPSIWLLECRGWHGFIRRGDLYTA